MTTPAPAPDLPNGLYELATDVETTINRDKRATHDWRLFGKWSAGTRFEIKTENYGGKIQGQAIACLDSGRSHNTIPIWPAEDVTDDNTGAQLARFLLGHLKPYTPPTFGAAWSLIPFDRGYGAGSTMLSALVKSGRLSEAEAIDLVTDYRAGELDEDDGEGDEV